MRSEEQMKFSQRYARFSSQPQSLLGKLLTLVLGAAFLVLAFMFSLVALAVAAVGGLMPSVSNYAIRRQIIRCRM
jgi:predicted phage tail protein